MFVATSDPSHDVGSAFIGSPIRAAVILLGIYTIATYLAVAGVIHVLAWPDAAAVVAPDISLAPALDAVASNAPVSAAESLRRGWPGQESERTDTSRECMLSEAIDTKCIFN
jgi:hypothetical protein